jgi:hypothetical protein
VGLAKRKARPAKVRSLTLLLMLCSLARQIYDIDSKHQKEDAPGRSNLLRVLTQNMMLCLVQEKSLEKGRTPVRTADKW